MPVLPYAFSPILRFYDESDGFMYDRWRGTGLVDEAYFAARNDAAPLVVAAQTGDHDAVRTLLATGSANMEDSGLEGETALHMAAALGYLGIVQSLLGAGANVDALDKEQSTPLTHCIRFCPSPQACQVALALLAAGANPIHMITIDLAKFSPLWFAIIENKEELVRVLEPLTPLTLDTYPPASETSPNHIVDAAIQGADKHVDTSILRFLIATRISLTVWDTTKATRNDTFALVVSAIPEASGEEVTKNAVPLLWKALYRDPRQIYTYLKRLVVHYGIDINDSGIQEFLVRCRSIPNLQGVDTLGLDTPMPN
ncbi:hypothetical protein NQ176_g5881 [Zarea fungicola]|uniref:Uncharacterized protein n=1 Tax=Zarea fungicola TaxID=93591 RepID=A0ACC1N818_9HYPO|nr:hypothetical protein NQ176_g5881 [Lecanicillium fungicola]